ncbi:MAG: hemerythrin domain-containing protein [Candidatus Pacearchaeota archaeon]
MKEPKMKEFCIYHLKNLDKNREKIKSKLELGHPIHTLMSEHEIILSFLDKIKKINSKIQKMKSYRKDKSFEILKNTAEHLIEAESHHEREEKVLFPELEKRGIFGPPEVMKEEHRILRKAKKELSGLAKMPIKNFSQFKERLKELENLITPTLKDHIAKEDNILYPMSLQVIKNEKEWAMIKKKCDKIGYCCFTPNKKC